MFRLKLAKILKLTLVIALLILCALLAWALVLFVIGLHVLWWVKAMILTCLGATLIVVVLLRKMWLKRKEMKFVDGIIGSDMPGNISAADNAKRELRRRFKDAVVTLKKSHLKGRGNPLYVLPWYLMVGKSGSGKSTAVRSARLPSPFGDINRISGVEGTRNCDWWFFDDSVVIDIAGRYSLHRNKDLDKSEWLAFLNHLVRYRKKEPINGIIVTVEADQLLEADPEKIEDEGRTIRKRIDEVIHVMGAKFPIYLMVTKCDLVFGMSRFCHLLTEPFLDQAMGIMNHDDETDIEFLVDQTMDAIVDKLKDIRLVLSNKEEVSDRHYLDPEVLLFPDELARLRKGLLGFCIGAFKDNPFQELPPLRGIYFCSGQQSGRPVLSKANATSKIGSEELPGTGTGIFLHDFFARILPGDRFLYAPTRRAKDWKRLTGNLWLTGFITVVLLFCIVLTHSWNENKAAINAVSPQYKQTILFENDPVADTAMMAEFGKQIKKIEQINADWKTPRMGLKASLRLEKNLKKRYCQRFYEHFDADINHKIEGQVANGGWQKENFAPAVRFIPFITRRINLIKARFDGAGCEQMAQLPDPDYALMLFAGDQESAANEVLSHYKNAFINYLIWQGEVEPLNKSLAGMQRLLSNYFTVSQGDMRWLVDWANRHMRGEAITMNDFWHGSQSDAELASIRSAFTHKGQKLIGHFVNGELEAAVGQNLFIAQPKEQFSQWYQDVYYGAWMTFCRDFNKSSALFATDDDWETALASLTSEATPYLRLFNRLDEELFSVLEDDPWPSLKLDPGHEEKYAAWLAQVRNFGIVRHAAAGDGVAHNQAAKMIGNRVAGKVGGKTVFAAKIALGTMAESRLAKAGEAYRQYQSAMAGFAGITTDRKYAYQLVRDGFEDNPAAARSYLQAAQKAVDNLQIALAPDNKLPGKRSDDPFWSLLNAPLEMLWQFSVAQSGCYLQELWDREVIVKLQGIWVPRQRAVMLFGNQGLVQSYMKKHAGPFVQQSSSRGYYAVKRHGASIPYRNGFFDYIKRGQRWWATSGGSIEESYPVSVAAYPTDVNVEAHIKPYMTRLIMEDTEHPTILENKQYPVEKKFAWLPTRDGNVVLQILFENITLSVRYSGYCAFGQFLKDFSEGYKRFKAEHFPEQLTELNRIGVREIEVTYRMLESQVRPIKRLMRTIPGKPPGKIVRCEKPER